MKVIFLKVGNEGRAKYNPDTGEYTWEYEGAESEIIDLLSAPDNGKVFLKMDSAPAGSDIYNTELVGEDYVYMSWDEHIEELALRLEKIDGVEVRYLGS